MNDNENINNNYNNLKIPANSNIYINKQIINNLNYNNSASKKKNLSKSKNNSKKEIIKIPKINEPPPLEILTPNLKKYQFYINKPEKNKKDLFFKDNKISTTKYNIFTFLPKALLYQFMRLANIYFLFIAIIQSIPIISPLGAMSAIAPLVVVLSVSLIREAIEDYNRGKLDKEQNNEPVEVFANEKWQNTTSGQLKMGQIVSVKKDGIFPADLVLIDSCLNEGICYIETGTLDGEKTLKIKTSPDFTKGKFGVFGKPEPKEEDLSKISNLSSKSKNSHNEGLSEREKFANIDEESVNNKNDNENENENNLIKKKISYFSIEGNCQCDFPNAALYQLNGKINLRINGIGNEFALDAKNLLLKGAKLRNTDWIIGIVIYTGHNCKIMKNSKEPIVKFSSIEKLMNKLLFVIFGVLVFLSILSGIFHDSYYINHENVINQSKNFDIDNRTKKFIDYLPFSLIVDSILSFFTYLLLLNTLIPISLIITLEIVKIIQGFFISFDIEGYSEVREKYIQPNSVSLNEELGTVHYIFTDKTGTLTCNKMLFKFCVIADACYEFLQNDYENNKDLRQKESIIPFENYDMINASSFRKGNGIFDNEVYNNYFCRSLKNKNISFNLDKTEKIIEEFWKALSLCHDCNIQNGELIGMNPDNIELVRASKLQGFSFEESEISSQIKLILGDSKGKSERIFEKLSQLEFSSDRKRESIIVKEGNYYKLYIKGADSIIEERLDTNSFPKEILERSKYFVNLFSAKGYRTLLVGMRILSQQEYEEFIFNLEQAKLDTEHKKEKLESVYNSVESNITLLGATIVEDKLQDNVPEVIKDLRQAGIKIWMLTGDKLNTAYNIALSCNLISQDFKTFFLEGKDVIKNEILEDINKFEREEVILNFVKEFKKFKGEFLSTIMPKFGILVDEKALLTINENESISRSFLHVAKDAVAVICCRVSPLQKSQVVKMMKNYDKSKITLAIGDGGNDVSMIMEAHIGIGIYGEEGLRAAQSSDYALGEFKILRRLLLFHGSLCIMRNSEMVIYFFYKNFVFTIIHFFYGFYNDFSGQTIIDDWFITCFNLIFTSIPLAAKAILDIDLRPEDSKLVYKMQPYLYFEEREFPKFSIFKFLFGLTIGIVHAIINYFVCISCVSSSIDKDGNLGDLWYTSVNIFTNILLIVTSNLIVSTRNHTLLNIGLIIITTFILYIIFLLAVHKMSLFNSIGTMNVAFNSGKMWFSLICVTGFCFLLDYTLLVYNNLFIENIRNIIKQNKNKSEDEYIEKINNLILKYESSQIKKKKNKKTKHIEKNVNYNDQIKQDNYQIFNNENNIKENKDFINEEENLGNEIKKQTLIRKNNYNFNAKEKKNYEQKNNNKLFKSKNSNKFSNKKFLIYKNNKNQNINDNNKNNYEENDILKINKIQNIENGNFHEEEMNNDEYQNQEQINHGYNHNYLKNKF